MLPPNTRRLDAALSASSPLASLRRRLDGSNRRLATVTAALPPGLRAQVRAGGLDDDGWTLVASNAAVAAKLRQMLPGLGDALKREGLERPPIRIRLAGSGQGGSGG